MSADFLCAAAALVLSRASVVLCETRGTHGIALQIGVAADRALTVGDATEAGALLSGGILRGRWSSWDHLAALDDHHAPSVAFWAFLSVEAASAVAVLAVVNGDAAQTIGGHHAAFWYRWLALNLSILRQSGQRA